jgi:hypothetical protein
MTIVATFKERLHAAGAKSVQSASDRQRLEHARVVAERGGRETEARRDLELEREIPALFRELIADRELSPRVRYRGPLPYDARPASHFYELLWQEGPTSRAFQLVMTVTPRDPAGLRPEHLEYGFLQDGKYVAALRSVDPLTVDRAWLERAVLTLIDPEPWENGTVANLWG